MHRARSRWLRTRVSGCIGRSPCARTCACGFTRFAGRVRIADIRVRGRSTRVSKPSRIASPPLPPLTRRRLVPAGVGDWTRGYPALSKRAGTPFRARQRGVSLSRRSKPQLACSKPVSLGLFEVPPSGGTMVQEARAKPARRTVKSERPGLPAGAFAFCGVRTAFCDKGLRARRSLGVGQSRESVGGSVRHGHCILAWPDGRRRFMHP